MRIAICSDFYPPQLSGVADSVEILATELRRRGHVVRVYAPRVSGSLSGPDIMHLPSYAISASAGAMAFVLPAGGMRDMRRFKPDIIHTHTFSTVGLLALYASWRLKVPLFGTDHTFPADYLRYAGLDFKPFRFLVRKFAAWYYNRCVFVTAPSRSMLDELAAYGMRRPMRAISNHVPGDIFHPLPGKNILKEKYGIASRAILIFGRIAPEKNLDAAVAIYDKVAERSDSDLVFIGDGPYRQGVERLVRKNGLEHRVRFLGRLHREDLVEAINACDVFLITSLSETQSMTTLQAMACGLPVVAADWGGIPEYVHDGEEGYVIDPRREDIFSDRLLSLLSNPALAQKMGDAGRKSVEKFSPERITGEFEELYSSQIRKKTDA